MNTENLKKEIRKIKVGHVALLCAGVFLAFAIIGSILIAAGGGWLVRGFNIDFHNFVPIGPGTLYDVDDREELDMAGVERITIESVSDNVTVLSGGEKTVATLQGQCRSALGPVKLSASKNGSTLAIEVQYPRTISNSNTRLTVTIPESYGGDLSVKTVSGGIYSEGLPQKLGNVTLHAVSGNIRFGAQSFTEGKADTTSGGVRITGITGRTTVTTVSGHVELDYTAAVATTVRTVSGSVDASIPESAAFQVDYGTVSGSFRDRKSTERGFKGSMPGALVLFKVDTTSGDFVITGK
jgi:hypothetical protein